MVMSVKCGEVEWSTHQVFMVLSQYFKVLS